MGEEQLHLSARLRALANLVPTGSVLADIGTDHAWIPADLLQRGRIQSAIALDIGVGPLARAAANLASLGLSEVVSLRQSDGFVALKPGEADCVLIAGMGGQLMQNILTRGLSEGGRPGPAFRESVKRYVFSPHTEWESFRTYLAAPIARPLPQDFPSRLRAVSAPDCCLSDIRCFALICRSDSGKSSSFWRSCRMRQHARP